LGSQPGKIDYTRTEESSEISVCTQLRLHGGNSVQCTGVILCAQRLGILTNLKREVNQGNYDGDTADELTDISEGLEIHEVSPDA
jgi:hypothetical protein